MPEKQYYDADGKPISIPVEKVFYDLEGKPIDIKAIGPQTISLKPNTTPKTNPQPKISDKDFDIQETFRKYIGTKVRPMVATPIGAITGTALGGGSILGSLFGGMAGNEAGIALENALPNWFGSKDTTPNISGNDIVGGTQEHLLQDLKESGLQTLFGAGANSIADKVTNVTAGGSNFKKEFVESPMKNLLLKMFPQNNPPSVVKALRNSNEPISVGQATGNEGLENIFGGQAKRDLKRTQQTNIERVIEKTKSNLDDSELLSDAQKLAKAKSKTLRTDTKEAYNKFDDAYEQVPTQYFEEQAPDNFTKPLLGPNGKPLPIPPKIVPIEKPIVLDKSISFANEVKTSLEEGMSSDPTVKAALGPVYQSVNNLTALGKNAVTSTGQPTNAIVGNYDKLKNITDQIENSLSSKEMRDALGDRSLKALGALRNWIDHDIEQTISSNPELLELHNAAKERYAVQALALNNNVAAKVLALTKNPNLAYKAVADEALSDQKMASQFILVTGDRRILTQLYTDKLMKSVWNTGLEKAEPAKAIEALINDPVAKVAIPSQQRSNMLQTMRVWQAQSQDPSSLGKFVVSLKRANAVLRLASAPVGFALGGSVGHGAMGAAGFMTVELGLEQFAKKIMLDPKYSRMVLEGSKTLGNSPGSMSLSRQLLKALAGSGISVALNNPDGGSLKGEIKGDGSFIPEQ